MQGFQKAVVDGRHGSAVMLLSSGVFCNDTQYAKLNQRMGKLGAVRDFIILNAK